MKKWIRVDDVRGRAERYVCDHAGEKKSVFKMACGRRLLSRLHK